MVGGGHFSVSSRARAARKVAAVAFVAAVACTLVWTNAASADPAPTPSILLTPRTDLVDGSVVAVTGNGYAPNQAVLIGECKIGACVNFILVFASATGTISANFTVRMNPPGFSCLTEACFVSTLNGTSPFAFIVGTPLWFRNTSGSVAAHAMTVTPQSGLSEGQVVSASGSNFYSGYTPIWECSFTDVLVCGPPVVTWANPIGSFTTPFTVHRSFEGQQVTATAGGFNGVPSHVDCLDPVIAPNGCFLLVDQGGPFHPEEEIDSFVGIFFAAASKADCVNDGWQRVVDADGQTFKNQGQCIAFIATGGEHANQG